MINRRSLVLACGSLLAPLATRAQPAGKVYRIGYLGTDPSGQLEGWEQAMAKAGWITGKNLTVETRFSRGRYELLPKLAADLVGLNVDVIVVEAAPQAEAAKQATTTIPIVFLMHGDPVGRGHVASLARPGGNITGASQMLPELSAKRLQLLKQLLPRISRVAVLWNAANPAKAVDWKATQEAAGALAIALDSCEVRGPDDFQAAFATARRARPDALMTLEDPLSYMQRAATVEFAASAHLPAIYGSPGYAEIGGLMSYHINLDEFVRLNVYYVDKILRGARPADLPVQQPTTFSLVVNLRTAKELNLTIPQAILNRAEVVIG